MQYDVFISCKSEDYKYAEEVYEFLTANGINTFLASKELRKLGESEYRKAISKALKSTYHMIVFASQAEFIDTTWVYYEWDWFINAKLKGFKPGQIVTILKDVNVDDINADLWKYESFVFSNFRENLLSYVATPAYHQRKEEERKEREVAQERAKRKQDEQLGKQNEAKAQLQYDVFISYSRKDSEVAKRICKAFDEVGISYFIDLQGISGGENFTKTITSAIKKSAIFLFLASKNAYDSIYTNKEVNYAVKKKECECLVPYIIDNSELPDELDFVLSDVNWRRMEEHPIDTVLVDDLLYLLGREKKRRQEASATPSTGNPNEEPMAYWYREAAEQGNAEAQVNLAYCYYAGSGVEQDYAEAVKWYRKAAEKGNAKAQFSLGACYEFSLGVGQDYTQATKWYRKAAEQGHAEAQGFLGVCYYNALGVARDYHQAAQWYRKAADQGVAEAQKNMGVCYANGHGVAQDYAQAMKWFRMAAEQGNAVAQKYLADCYAMGYREAE